MLWVQFPVEEGNFLLKNFKPLDINSGLKCKCDYRENLEKLDAPLWKGVRELLEPPLVWPGCRKQNDDLSQAWF